MSEQYVYLIQTNRALSANEQVFKIGRSKAQNFKRLRSYEKEFILFLVVHCSDCQSLENVLLEKFKIHFKHRTDYGNEYFEGDIEKIQYLMLAITYLFELQGADMTDNHIASVFDNLSLNPSCAFVVYINEVINQTKQIYRIINS